MSAKAPRPEARSKGGAPAAMGAAVDQKELRELTETIAYELYEKRGRTDGRDLDDWLTAEKIARERLRSGKE